MLVNVDRGTTNLFRALNLQICGFSNYIRYCGSEHCLKAYSGDNITRYQQSVVLRAGLTKIDISEYTNTGWSLTNELKKLN